MAFGDIPPRGRFSEGKVPREGAGFEQGWKKLSKASQAWFGFNAHFDGVGDGDVLPRDDREPIDPWTWCCVPIWLIPPGMGVPSLLKWICLPCPTNVNGHATRVECLKNCWDKAPPPKPEDGGGIPGEEAEPRKVYDDPVVIDVTFTSCCIHYYRWSGLMNMDFFHTLPGLDEFGDTTPETFSMLQEIKNSEGQGGPIDPGSPYGGTLDQDFYGTLLPGSWGVAVQGDAEEVVRKTNILKAVTTNSTGNHQVGDWDGELNPDCVPYRPGINRMFNIECRPMVYLPDESANWGMPLWKTKLQYSFQNETCITVHDTVLAMNPIFKGPMGTGDGAGGSNDGDYWKNCGGTECQCNSVGTWRFHIKADPENWDMLGLGFGTNGGPNGAFGGPQIIKTVEAQDKTHCSPCCQQTLPRVGGDHDVNKYTTGAWKLSAFLANFLLETGVSRNPNSTGQVVQAGESGNGACCVQVVKDSWREYFKPLMEGFGGSEFPADTQFEECQMIDRPDGKDRFETRSDLAKVTGQEMMSFPNGLTIPHQGLCSYSSDNEPCTKGRIGDSFDHIHY